jgi:hypothetical protein
MLAVSYKRGTHVGVGVNRFMATESLQWAYTYCPTVVLRGKAFPYERGTPVGVGMKGLMANESALP